MKGNQLNLDHLAMIKLYVHPRKSKKVILKQMIQSQSVLKGKSEFE